MSGAQSTAQTSNSAAKTVSEFSNGLNHKGPKPGDDKSHPNSAQPADGKAPQPGSFAAATANGITGSGTSQPPVSSAVGSSGKAAAPATSMQFGTYDPAEAEEQPVSAPGSAPREAQSATTMPTPPGASAAQPSQQPQSQAASKPQGGGPGLMRPPGTHPSVRATGSNGPSSGGPPGPDGLGQARGGHQGSHNASSQQPTRQPSANQQVPRQHSGALQGGNQRSSRGMAPPHHMPNSLSPPGVGPGMPPQHPQVMSMQYAGYGAAYPMQPFYAQPGAYAYPPTYVNTAYGGVQGYYLPGSNGVAQPVSFPQMPQPPPHHMHARPQGFNQPGMHQGLPQGNSQQQQQQHQRNPRGVNHRHGGSSGPGHGAPPHAQQGGQNNAQQASHGGGHQRPGPQQDQPQQLQQARGQQSHQRSDSKAPNTVASAGSTGLPSLSRPKPQLAQVPRKILSLVNPDTQEDLSSDLDKLRKETESKEAAAKKLAPQSSSGTPELPIDGDESAGEDSGSLPSGAVPQVQRPPQRAVPERRPIAIVAPPEADSTVQAPAVSKGGSSTSGQDPSAKAATSESDKPEPNAQPEADSYAARAKADNVAKQQADKASADKVAADRATADRAAADKATANKAAADKAAADKAAADKAAADKAAADKAAADKATADKAAADKAAADKAAADKAKADKTTADKAKADKAAADKAAADKAAADKAAADKTTADKAAANKAAADKAIADKAAADKAAADKTTADKAAADKAIADKAAADKAADQKAANAKAAAEKVAAEQATTAKVVADKAKADEDAATKKMADAAADAKKEEDIACKSVAVAAPGVEGEASTAAPPPMSTKEKRKRLMANADKKGKGDEMDAYVSKSATVSEPLPSGPPLARTEAPAAAKAKSKPSTVAAAPPASQESSVDDDWEDSEGAPVSRPSAAKADASSAKAKAADESGIKKYTRDWLMGQRSLGMEPLMDLVGSEVAMSEEDQRVRGTKDRQGMPPQRGGPGGGGGFGPGRPGPGPDDYNQRGSMPPGMGPRNTGPPFRGTPAQPSDGAQWAHTSMPGRGPAPGGPPGMNRAGSMRAPAGGIQADIWARGTLQPPPAPPGMSGPNFHKAENSYKLGATRTEDPEEEKKQKAFNALLNKLTPDNFDRILTKMLDVGVTSPKTLRGLIDRIFDKALTEVTFTELYAELCVRLNAALPGFEDPNAGPSEGNRKLSITFRRVLLNKCQEEFEAGDNAMKAVDAREKAKAESAQKAAAKKEAGEADGEDDDDEAADDEGGGSKQAAAESKDDSNEEKEEGEIEEPAETPAQAKRRRKLEEARAAAAEYKARQRMLGNIQFIGQLYNKGMLTDRIMHECIVKLLGEVSNPRQEDVECLCKMLRTIGKTLESKAADRARMDVYFGRIQSLSQNSALESRVRFGLQDMRELRYHGWQERRKADGPKKIAEVHAEAKEQLRQQTMAQSRSRHGPGPSDHRRRDISDYGGPPRGQTGMSMDRASSRPLLVDTPLRTINSANTGGFGLRPGGAPRLGPAGIPRNSSPPRERKKLVLDPRSAAALTPVEQPTASEPEAPLADEAQPASKDVSEVVLPVVKEFLRNDPKEGLLRYQEAVEAEADMAAAVATWCNIVRDERTGSWSWADVPKMFMTLHASSNATPLSVESIQGGLVAVLESLADSAIDAPQYPVQIGGVIGDLVAEGVLELKFMTTRIQQAGEAPEAPGGDAGLVESGVAASVAAAALEHLAKAKGADSAMQAWAAVDISLKSLLMEADREDDAAVNKLADKHDLKGFV